MMSTADAFCVELEDEAATAAFAARLWRECSGGLTIGLSGALGAGKTTFVRYFAHAAGVRPSEVSSPSFVLQQEYAAGGVCLEHWDLYRLSGAPDELLDPPAANVIRLIEWPEKAPELILDISVRLEFEDFEKCPGRRKIFVERRR